MEYRIISRVNKGEYKVGSIIAKFPCDEQANDFIEEFLFMYKLKPFDVYVERVIECQTCGKNESEERFDYYGYSTGYHCDDCYHNSSKYKYRKDAYPKDDEDRHWDALSTHYERFCN